MERLTKSAYLQSYNYKMVYILSRLRRLSALNGETVPSAMYKALDKELCPEDYIYDNNFLMMAELGNIQLNEEAVKKYAEYIAAAYKYDFSKFYSALKYEAMNLEFGKDDTKNVKAAIKAIYGIYNDMKK